MLRLLHTLPTTFTHYQRFTFPVGRTPHLHVDYPPPVWLTVPVCWLTPRNAVYLPAVTHSRTLPFLHLVVFPRLRLRWTFPHGCSLTTLPRCLIYALFRLFPAHCSYPVTLPTRLFGLLYCLPLLICCTHSTHTVTCLYLRTTFDLPTVGFLTLGLGYIALLRCCVTFPHLTLCYRIVVVDPIYVGYPHRTPVFRRFVDAH